MDQASFLAQLAAPDHPDLDARAVAVVVAHPDDEVVGVGGQLARLRGVSILHVTDGAPRVMPADGIAGFTDRAAYAAARRRESVAALALAGVPEDRLHGLGVADQTATLCMAGLARRVADWLTATGAELVLTHPYEGGHPDHDATAFAVHLAVQLAERQGRLAPALVEFTSYHGYGWRLRRRRPVVQRFLPPRVLPLADPARGATRAQAPPLALALRPAQRQLKQSMMECFVTQRGAMGLFDTQAEAFRAAPRYDFTRAPHPGRLNYEWRDWGTDGARWRRLAADAIELLAPDSPQPPPYGKDTANAPLPLLRNSA